MDLLSEEKISSEEYLSYSFPTYTYKTLPDPIKLQVGNHLENLKTTGIKFVYVPFYFVNSWHGMLSSVVGFLIASYICKHHVDRNILGGVICDDAGRLIRIDEDKETEFINELLLQSCKFYSDIEQEDFFALTLLLLKWKGDFLKEITGDIGFMGSWKEITRLNYIRYSLIKFMGDEENKGKEETIAEAKSKLTEVESQLLNWTTQFLKVKNLYLNLKHN